MISKELEKFADHWNTRTWGSCGRKKRYETRSKATASAMCFYQRVYHCETCGGYHCSKQLKEGPDGNPS